MTMPAPSVEYALLSPMLIVFGVAVTGLLVEAFLPRRNRYVVQLALSTGALVAAFVAVVMLRWTPRHRGHGLCRRRRANAIPAGHNSADRNRRSGI